MLPHGCGELHHSRICVMPWKTAKDSQPCWSHTSGPHTKCPQTPAMPGPHQNTICGISLAISRTVDASACWVACEPQSARMCKTPLNAYARAKTKVCQEGQLTLLTGLWTADESTNKGFLALPSPLLLFSCGLSGVFPAGIDGLLTALGWYIFVSKHRQIKYFVTFLWKEDHWEMWSDKCNGISRFLG